MLCSTHDLKGLVVQATDGPIGEVSDLYFDDETWIVRYLVIEAGRWLSSRRVLVPREVVGHLRRGASRLAVAITRQQVRDSPDLDTDKPVSRQHEVRHLAHYGVPSYWAHFDPQGGGPRPGTMLPGFGLDATSAGNLQMNSNYVPSEAEHKPDGSTDPHLRSCQAIIGYHIQASDGDIGHVEGMLVEEQTWALRYLIVNTSNWWIGHQTLIAPQWIKKVSWPEQCVAVDAIREVVKAAPTYDPSVAMDRDQELRIFEHYGRASYWTSEASH